MSSPKLIGLTGQAGAGKDLVAAFLKMRSFARFGFADEVRKEVASNQALLHQIAIHGLKKDDFYKKPLHPLLRKILQTHGTEYRRSQDPEYWIKKLKQNIESSNVGAIVISDVRFQNEAAFIKEYAPDSEIWRVDRPGLQSDSHVSEQEYLQIKPDHVISNDGDLQHLAQQVIEALDSYA